jgi:hypothetical protein
MALRASPVNRGRIAITTRKFTPPDGGIATRSIVGNVVCIDLRNDASNANCLSTWFSVVGLPVSSAWK